MSAQARPGITGTGRPGTVLSGGRGSGEFPADAGPFADPDATDVIVIVITGDIIR